MAKIRIYELARTLNMTNKALLAKLKEMGLAVKSHMSSLEQLEAEDVKRKLFGAEPTDTAAVVEQKRIKKNVIRKRRQPTKSNAEETESADAPEPVAAEDPDASAESTTPAEAEGAAVVKEPTKAREAPKKKTPAKKTAPLKAVKAKDAVPEEEPAEKEAGEEEKAVERQEATEEEAPAPSTKKAKPKKKAEAAKIIKFIETPQAPEPALKPERKGPAPMPPDVTPIPESETPDDKDAKKGRKARKKKKKSTDSENDVAAALAKKKVSRRREIIEGGALYDRPRGRGGKRVKGRAKTPSGAKTQITTPKASKRKIKIDESILVAELAKRMGVKANELIGKLMGMGVMTTLNQSVDFDTALLVAADFGFEVERAINLEADLLKVVSTETDDPEKMRQRAPVVTIMGHVDHGKTSLLDVIRESSVTEGEAGGITQHIGAYKVDGPTGAVVFLDTPGHEAFTAMRARGAQVTDIVVLVVAADDGVMPQTIEAINHSKAAGVPIVVAVNKIDKDNADVDRVKREVSEHGLVPEDWGGDAIFVNVSAKQKQGINDLLDMILLQSEMLELKANPDKKAHGVVIESRLDPNRGPVATVLIQEGTLSAGEAIVCGIHYGKIRAMLNDKGEIMDTAGPSTPVGVLGLSGVVSAGDELVAVGDEKNAKLVSQGRTEKQRQKDLARSSRVSLENFFEKMQADDINTLNVIIKADVNGSCEAIEDSLNKIVSDEVKVSVVHSGVGTIIESDVSLASASNAIILGFNVRASAKVKALAQEENVELRFYEVIYDLIGEIKEALTGMMAPTLEENILGRAEVKDLFVIPKKGTIAGSMVTDGKIERGQQARLIRDGVVIYNGVVSSLRRFKDDAKEVKQGFECGIGIEKYNDIKVDDIIECYYYKEIKPVLE